MPEGFPHRPNQDPASGGRLTRFAARLRQFLGGTSTREAITPTDLTPDFREPTTEITPNSTLIEPAEEPVPELSAPNYTVTYVSGAAEVHITSDKPDDDPTILAYKMNSKAAEVSQLLQSLLRAAGGPGEHLFSRVAHAMDEEPDVLRRILDRSTVKQVPEHILKRGETNHGWTITEWLRLGNIALFDTRPATLNEQDRYHERRNRPDTQKIAERLKSEDAEKTNLLDHEQAIVNFRGHTYALPLESREAILAARLFQFWMLQNTSTHNELRQQILPAIWQLMPLAERELFVDQKRALSDMPPRGRLEDMIARQMRDLMRQAAITREPSGDKFKLEENVQLTIKFEKSSSVQNEALPYIFPPNTPPTRILAAESRSISKEDLQYAHDKVAGGFSALISHDEAIELLDFLRTKPGRRALVTSFINQKGEMEAQKILDMANGQARRALGDTDYIMARRNRMIAGHKATGRGGVRQTGGELYANITRWYIGRPEEFTEKALDPSQ